MARERCWILWRRASEEFAPIRADWKRHHGRMNRTFGDRNVTCPGEGALSVTRARRGVPGTNRPMFAVWSNCIALRSNWP